MPLPLDEITREDIEAAILSLDEGVEHHFGASVTYDVLYAGRRYPPKAVVGFAAKLAVGREFFPKDFHGGEGGGSTNILLRRLGFEVVSKSTPALTSEDFDLLTRNQAVGRFPDLPEKDRTGYKRLRKKLLGFSEAIKADFEEAGEGTELKAFATHN